jgi:GT2 family glycosyltransferase
MSDLNAKKSSSLASPPITTGIESFLNKILCLLPRVPIDFRLSPEKDLVADPKIEHAWWAYGNSPSFILSGDAVLFSGNWFYIEGVIQRYNLSKAKLYYDDGSGFNESNSIIIPVTRRGYIRELVNLPSGIVGLRWTPIDSIGFFLQQSLSLTQICPIEASLRALYRVLFDFYRFILTNERRRPATDKLLKPLLKLQLQKAYQNTKELRVFDCSLRSPSDLWLTYCETMRRNTSIIKKTCAVLDIHPIITIITSAPVLDFDHFEMTIQSLRKQIYQQWELIVVCAIPHPKIIHPDSRISFVNENANEALLKSKGTHVVFLDISARLEPQALLRFAWVFQKYSPDLIYSDGVQMNEDFSQVVDFICRPSFSPELLRRSNYIDHLTAYNRGFLVSIGTTENGQYDLLLKTSEKAVTVVHIPEFLYQAPVSTSPFADAPLGKNATRIENLQKHLQRCNCKGAAVPHEWNQALLRITYSMNPGQRVAIIIPTKNAGELVRQCIESLKQTILNAPYDIVIIDHDSQDPESLKIFEELAEHHNILRYSGDFNFSRINNWAVQQLTNSYSHYLFCNNDIEAIHSGWLETMLGFGQMADVGVVGAELLYPDNNHIQHAGVCIGLNGPAEHYGKFLSIRMREPGHINTGGVLALTIPHEVSAVTGACMLIRRDAFESVGGFDENMAVGFGDVDLCLRIGEAGFRCIYSPDSSLIHHESLSRGKDGGDPHPIDKIYFKKRWHELLKSGDPYFNPAYSRHSFSWQYTDPLPCSTNPAARAWKRKPC